MILCIWDEAFEVDELISQIEVDIVSLEVIIKKLIQHKDLKVSTLKLLKNF